jgi:hypothetical protein
MSIEINKSTDFRINEIYILSKSGDPINIAHLFDEINLFDSMLIPVCSGNILMVDSLGLYGKLFFDGSESIFIDISKSSNSENFNFKKSYRIYKVSNKSNYNLTTQKYLIHFVSEEFIYSEQLRINQSYEMSYSDIVKKVMVDYLKVPSKDLTGYFNDSMGVRRVVIPNLNPIEAIQWCAKRAVDQSNSPDFIFFQNSVGYNFTTLSKLLPQEAIVDIKFQMKNLKDSNAITDMSSARSLEYVNQVNAIERQRSGVDSGKFIGFDPITRMIETKKVSYQDHFEGMEHGNQTPGTSVI